MMMEREESLCASDDWWKSSVINRGCGRIINAAPAVLLAINQPLHSDLAAGCMI